MQERNGTHRFHITMNDTDRMKIFETLGNLPCLYSKLNFSHI